MRELLLGPGEEGIHDGLGMGEAIIALGRAGEGLIADLGLDAIELADALQRLGTGRGLDVLGTLEATAGMRPALRMGDAGALAKACVGRVAVGDQHAACWRVLPEPPEFDTYKRN